MAEGRYNVVFILCGCPDPEAATATAPMGWSTGDISSVPGGAPANLAAATIRRRIRADGVDGFVSQVSLGNPVSAGGILKFKLTDAPRPPGVSSLTWRELSQLFNPDSAQASTAYWSVRTSVAFLGQGVTTFVLAGPQVVINDIIWIEEEAVQITAVTQLAVELWEVTVTRGVLGSRAREHAIGTNYPAGSSGAEFCLTATSRPDFDRYPFDCELHYVRMEGTTAAEVVRSYYRQTEGRPIPRDNLWEVSTKDLGAAAKKKTAGRGSGPLSFAVQVLERGNHFGNAPLTGVGSGPSTFPAGASQATKVRVWMTPEEADRRLSRRLRYPDSGTVDQTATTDFNSKLFYTPPAGQSLGHEFVLACGGYDWVYQATAVGYAADAIGGAGFGWNTSVVQELVYVDGDLVTYVQDDGKVGKINDQPVDYPSVPPVPNPNLQVVPRRPLKYNQGWSDLAADPIRADQGEERPTFKMRSVARGFRPVQWILTLLLSRHGGGVGDADYDLIPGDLCPGFKRTMFSMGVAPGSALGVDPRTKNLLELDALLTHTEDIYFEWDGFDVGAELTRVAGLYNLISVQAPGGYTFRQIAAPVQAATPTPLKQVVGPRELVSQGTRLAPVRSLKILGGAKPISLEPKWAVEPFAWGFQTDELGAAVEIRTWQPGGSPTPGQLLAGPLGRFLQVRFLLQRGAPPVYKVKTKVPYGVIDTGDLVAWTDGSIPTAAGRGVTSKRMLVIGVDLVFTRGDQWVYLIDDILNDLSTYEGTVGLSLIIERAELAANGTTLNLIVDAIGVDESFEITGTPTDIYQSLVDNNGFCRVLVEDLHNPAGALEREGMLEFYGVVTACSKEAGSGKNFLTVEIDLAWSRGGFSPTDIVEGASYVEMADLRLANFNIAGVDIAPDDAQGNGFAVVAPGSGSPTTSRPYGGQFTAIAA